MQIRHLVEKAVAFSDAFLNDESDELGDNVTANAGEASLKGIWDNMLSPSNTDTSTMYTAPIVDPQLTPLYPLIEIMPSVTTYLDNVQDNDEEEDVTISKSAYQNLLHRLEETQNNEYLFRVEKNRLYEEYAALNRKFETVQDEYGRMLKSSDKVKHQRELILQNQDQKYKDVCDSLSDLKLEYNDACRRADGWKQKYEESLKRVEAAQAKLSSMQDFNHNLQSEIGELRKSKNSSMSVDVSEDYKVQCETLEKENRDLQAELHGLTYTLAEQESSNVQLSSTINSQMMQLKRLQSDNETLKLNLEKYKADHELKTSESSFSSSRLKELEKKTQEQNKTIHDLQNGLQKLLHKLHERKVFEEEIINTETLRSRINTILSSHNGKMTKLTQRKIREIILNSLNITEKEARDWGLVSGGLTDQFVSFLEGT